MRSRTGYVYQNKKTGTWYARVCYKQPNGRRTSVKRRADNKTDAKQVLKRLIETLDDGGRDALEAEKITFKDLCDYYEAHYAVRAQYVNNRKVAGLRSVAGVRGYLRVFRAHFNEQPLKSVTYDDLRAYRAKRLNTPTHQSA